MLSRLFALFPIALFFFVLVIAGGPLRADDKAVSILAAKIGGHIHPSICRTPDGALLAVYRGSNVMMCSRSTDGGASWEQPLPIAATAKRPEVIRDTKVFEVYPGTADVLPDGRVLVTWNY